MTFNPYPWQEADLATLRANNYTALLNIDPGGTKTAISAMAIRDSGAKVTLVCAPKNTFDTAWIPTVRDVLGVEARVIGNGSKAERVAMADFELGVPGVYLVTTQLLARSDTSNWSGDFLVVDECFVAGTLIDTPAGSVAIESLKEGDEVYGFDHTTESVVITRVRGTMERSSHEVIPTGATVNHPYFVEGVGYLPVGDLMGGDRVLVRDKSTVCSVRYEDYLKTQRGNSLLPEVREPDAEETGRPEGLLRLRHDVYAPRESKKSRNVFQGLRGEVARGEANSERKSHVPGMRGGVHRSAFRGQGVMLSEVCEFPTASKPTEPPTGSDLSSLLSGLRNQVFLHTKNVLQSVRGFVGRQSWEVVERPRLYKPEQRLYDKTESQFQSRSGQEDAGDEKTSRRYLRPPRRGKRKDRPVRTTPDGRTARGVGELLRYPDERATYRGEVPSRLQSGRGDTSFEVGRRSGWSESPHQIPPRTGQEEGGGAGAVRVDSLEILEPRNRERFERVRRENTKGSPQIVYNLETGTSNYFANGVLVHNCHKTATPKSKAQRTLGGFTAADGEPLGQRFEHRLALSGTPIRQNFENMWSLMRFLWPHLDNAGQIADHAYYRWLTDRMVYDEVVTAFEWIPIQPNVPYPPDARVKVVDGVKCWGRVSKAKKWLAEAEPGRMVREMPCVITHFRRERCCEWHPNGFLSLEEPQVLERVVELHPAQKKAIRELEKHYVTWLGENPLVTELTITQQQRIRQVCLGVPTVTLAEDGQASVTFDEDCVSPFIAELLDILESMPDESVVVFLDSQKFASVVTARLNRAGVSAAEYSGATAKDRDEYLRKFGAEYRVLVGVTSAIGEGTDGLQHKSSTEVWMETPVSLTMQTQSQSRLDRMGQAKQVQRFVLLDSEGYAEGRVSSLLEKQLKVNASLRGGSNK